MRPYHAAFAAILVLIATGSSFAQSAQTETFVSVPRLINVTGAFQPAVEQPLPAVIGVTLSLYSSAEGGTPLWQESQTVAVDKTGKFSVLLGSTQHGGISPEVFAARDELWLAMQFAGTGEVEQARVRLASVPYALRAADADTLGGRPASAYVLAPPAGDASTVQGGSASAAAGSSDVVLAGTPNRLAKYVNAADVGDSAVFESGGLVGVGTTVPLDVMHLQFNNINGGMTGLAVQNMGNTSASYSGMLFYDQAGVLGQFQGFNNSTHEYRINNIAKNGGGTANGSINFMINTASRFFVASNGNVGIGTTSPFSNLEISNGISATPNALVMASTYNASSVGSQFTGRHARGTSVAPTALLANDGLGGFGGRGYGATGFGPGISGMSIRASENWTDAAQGTYLQFFATKTGTTAALPWMTLDATGRLAVGSGTFPSAVIEAVRDGETADFQATAYSGGAFAGEALFLARSARGTQASPSAVQNGDFIGGFGVSGFGTAHWGEFNAGMGAVALENWTDAAHGAGLGFVTTPLGATDNVVHMVIGPEGNVGIGTFPTIPAIADMLEVSGDIRVGTTGTNGCVKNFAGTGLIGTCSSDRRLKKDITPFAPVLNKVTALQPVHYFWRAAEFPDRHFGDSRAYGLIAQDVEQVLPEIVVTNADGFKAVDYSKLPLLTIQAVKELKSENDSLKQRVAELERLVTELLSTVRR
jgi:hypothetical protein